MSWFLLDTSPEAARQANLKVNSDIICFSFTRQTLFVANHVRIAFVNATVRKLVNLLSVFWSQPHGFIMPRRNFSYVTIIYGSNQTGTQETRNFSSLGFLVYARNCIVQTRERQQKWRHLRGYSGTFLRIENCHTSKICVNKATHIYFQNSDNENTGTFRNFLLFLKSNTKVLSEAVLVC